MTRLVFAAALALALTTAGHAQTMTARLDLGTLGWGFLTQPQAVDTDANPATQEWLIGQLFTDWRRVVAVQADGRLCAGPWFSVGPEWQLQPAPGRSRYVRLVWPMFEVLQLEHPVC